MFFRLTTAFPDHVVLAQVAFSALLTARTIGSRNTFDRKVADFVLMTKSFRVVAVIELDDASHRGRSALDAKRERLLSDVGYLCVRFANIPDTNELKAAITPTKPQNSDREPTQS